MPKEYWGTELKIFIANYATLGKFQIFVEDCKGDLPENLVCAIAQEFYDYEDDYRSAGCGYFGYQAYIEKSIKSKFCSIEKKKSKLNIASI
jgi:hypothetical protein